MISGYGHLATAKALNRVDKMVEVRVYQRDQTFESPIETVLAKPLPRLAYRVQEEEDLNGGLVRGDLSLRVVDTTTAAIYEAVAGALDDQFRVVLLLDGQEQWRGQLIPDEIKRDTYEGEVRYVLGLTAKTQYPGIEAERWQDIEGGTGFQPLGTVASESLSPIADTPLVAATDWYPFTDPPIASEPFFEVYRDPNALLDQDDEGISLEAIAEDTGRVLQTRLLQWQGEWRAYQARVLSDATTWTEADGTTRTENHLRTDTNDTERGGIERRRPPARQQSVRYQHGQIGDTLLKNREFKNEIQDPGGDGQFNWRPTQSGVRQLASRDSIRIEVEVQENIDATLTVPPSWRVQQFGGTVIGGPDRALVFGFNGRIFAGSNRPPGFQEYRLFYRLKVGDYYWDKAADAWTTSVADNRLDITAVQDDFDEAVFTAPLDDNGTPITGQIEVRLYGAWMIVDDPSAIDEDDLPEVEYQVVDIALEVEGSGGEDPEARLVTVGVVDETKGVALPEAVILSGDGPTSAHAQRLQAMPGDDSGLVETQGWQRGAYESTDDSSGTDLQELWGAESLQRRRPSAGLYEETYFFGETEAITPLVVVERDGLLTHWERCELDFGRWAVSGVWIEMQPVDETLPVAFAEEDLRPVQGVVQQREAGVITFPGSTADGTLPDAGPKGNLLLSDGDDFAQLGVGADDTLLFADPSGTLGAVWRSLADTDVNSALGYVPFDEQGGEMKGNVGIGTPAEAGTRLTIKENSDFLRLLDSSGAEVGSWGVNALQFDGEMSVAGPLTITEDNSNGVLRLARGGGNPSIVPASGENWMIVDGAGSGLGLNYYDSSKVIIANGGGNVGVNTTNPTAKLDLLGDGTNDLLNLRDTSGSRRYRVSEDEFQFLSPSEEAWVDFRYRPDVPSFARMDANLGVQSEVANQQISTIDITENVTGDIEALRAVPGTRDLVVGTSGSSGGIWVLDIDTYEVQQQLWGNATDTPTLTRWVQLSVTEDRQWLIAVSFSGIGGTADRLVIYDIENGYNQQRITSDVNFPQLVVPSKIHPDKFYYGDQQEGGGLRNELQLVDPSTGSVVKTYTGDEQYAQVVDDPATGLIYASNRNTENVDVIDESQGGDAPTDAQIDTITTKDACTPRYPSMVIVDDFLYQTMRYEDGIEKIDLKTRQKVGETSTDNGRLSYLYEFEGGLITADIIDTGDIFIFEQEDLSLRERANTDTPTGLLEVFESRIIASGGTFFNNNLIEQRSLFNYTFRTISGQFQERVSVEKGISATSPYVFRAGTSQVVGSLDIREQASDSVPERMLSVKGDNYDVAASITNTRTDTGASLTEALRVSTSVESASDKIWALTTEAFTENGATVGTQIGQRIVAQNKGEVTNIYGALIEARQRGGLTTEDDFTEPISTDKIVGLGFGGFVGATNGADAPGKLRLIEMLKANIYNEGSDAWAIWDDTGLGWKTNSDLITSADVKHPDWNPGLNRWGITAEGDADFRNITADTLQIDVFISNLWQSLSGNDVLTKAAADLAEAYTFTVGGQDGQALRIEVPQGASKQAQVFEDGDVIRLRSVDRTGGGLSVQDGWVRVDSLVSDLGEDEQLYSVSVLDVPDDFVARVGSRALDYGRPGDTLIERSVTDVGAPYDRILRWQDDAGNEVPTTFDVVSQLGNISTVSSIPETDLQGIYTDSARFEGDLIIGSLDKSGDYLEYDGQDLTVTGGIIADTGEVGGWTIESDLLQSTTAGEGQVTLSALDNLITTESLSGAPEVQVYQGDLSATPVDSTSYGFAIRRDDVGDVFLADEDGLELDQFIFNEVSIRDRVGFLDGTTAVGELSVITGGDHPVITLNGSGSSASGIPGATQSTSDADINIFPGPGRAVIISGNVRISSGNVSIGPGAHFDNGRLTLSHVPGASAPDEGVRLYAVDNNGTTELRAIKDDGTTTTLF